MPFANAGSGSLPTGSFPSLFSCPSLRPLSFRWRRTPFVINCGRGVDRRIIRLKLVLAWSVPILTSVGIKLCELFCNRVVPRDFSGELALCCCLSCGLLYLVLMLWINAQLNALAETCPAKGAE